jgi:hypothetical protein
MASAQKSQGSCELRMRDTEVNSIGALNENGRRDGCIATLQTKAQRGGCVALDMSSSRSLFNDPVVVSLVSILILRSSG